jgi:hypothetical protein
VASASRIARRFAQVEHQVTPPFGELLASRTRPVKWDVVELDPDLLFEENVRDLFGATVAVGSEGESPRLRTLERFDRRQAKLDGRRARAGPGPRASLA